MEKILVELKRRRDADASCSRLYCSSIFQSLGKHAVPLDHRAVAALSFSSMALDI